MNPKSIRNALITLALVAAVPLAGQQLRKLLQTDAFSMYKRPRGTDPINLRMKDVKFRNYRGTRLVTSAHAEAIEMSRDRFHTMMRGVEDGVYHDGKRKFRYDAEYADWNSGTRVLDISGGVHIRAESLDLRSPQVTFESRPQLLTAKGGVKGRVLGGRFGAESIRYQAEAEVYEVKLASWSGRIPAKYAQDAPAAVRQREWSLKSDSFRNSKQNPRIVTHTNAIATDGEVIVIAPTIVHNQDTDELVATGTDKAQVQYFSAESNMVADRVQVFRKEHRAVFGGKVVMLVKPKDQRDQKPKVEALPAFQPVLPAQVKADRPSADRSQEEIDRDEQLRNNKSLREYPLVLNAQKIEYWYARGARRAVITGDPQGRQELPDGRWRHLWTNVAYYDGEQEQLRLVSSKGVKDTRMKNSIGDDAVADWMLVSTAEDSEEFSGAGIEAVFVDLSGEDPRGTPKTEPKNPPPPTPKPKTGGGQKPPPSHLRRA